MSMLWPPTAASSSARRASGWPRTSARSGASAATRARARASRRGSSSSPRSQRDDLGQVPRAVHRACRVTSAASGGARARADERLEADSPRGLGRDQRTVHGPQPAVEARARRARARLPARSRGSCSLAARIATAIARSCREPELGDVAGREVDDDAALRPPQLARDDAGAHALARLVDRAIGQADDDRRPVLAPADAGLDLHELALDSDRRLTVGGGDHAWEARAS